ncbi:MAG: hypothetical protein HYV07_18455 [Deltaproteobacteria bacterium]|nr:hypothetical protein [Deltaproteobacteria bacterium]
MTELSGRTVASRYRVGEILGRNRDSTTYAAVQTGVFEREVVLEILSPELSTDRARVADVARRLARLRHSATVAPTDSGEIGVSRRGGDADSRIYFVRPPLLALTLEERLEREGASELEALRFAESVAECLEEAHLNGVAHGAIAPRSIWIEPVAGLDIVRIVFEVSTSATARPGSLGQLDDLFGLASIAEALAQKASGRGGKALTELARAIRDGGIPLMREARKRLSAETTRRVGRTKSRVSMMPRAALLDPSDALPTFAEVGRTSSESSRSDNSMGAVGFDEAEALVGEEQTEEERPGFGSEETETDLKQRKRR